MDQTQDLKSLLDEEQALQLPAFDVAAALRLGGRLQERGLRDKLPIAIEVSKGGDVVFFAMLPGASPDNGHWVRRKRAVVERFHHSSLYMKTLCDSQGRDLFERYALQPSQFAASGGAVPINVKGTGLVGAAVVSGLAAVDDHRLVTDALRDMLAGKD
jgi:uncharacterized protein (UPF0303 family)